MPACSPASLAQSKSAPPSTCRSTHPNDLGHRAVAELLAAAVARAVEEAQGGGSLLPAWLPGREEPLLAGMPPPMVPGNADAPTTLCAIQVRGAEGLHGGSRVAGALAQLLQATGICRRSRLRGAAASLSP